MRQHEPRVRGYAVTHPVGEVHLPTQDGWQQIIYARSGLFVASTDRQTWTVPPNRALWVADDSRIRVQTRRRTVIRCLYLRDGLPVGDPAIRVISVSPLTRELLLHAVESCPLDTEDRVDGALVTVLVDQLSAQSTEALELPLPRDGRAAAMAEAILADPATSIDGALASARAARRTIERLFRAETQMTLAGWRRRVRVLAAIESMAAGRSVTEAGGEVGYATPSSFVAAFRAELGQPPRLFMNERSR